MKTTNLKRLLLLLWIFGLAGTGLCSQNAPSPKDTSLQSDLTDTYDSLLQTSIHINYWYLKGKDGIEQRRLLVQRCDSFLCEYFNDLSVPEEGEPVGAIGNLFEIRPEESYIDHHISSTLYTITVQYAGAVHAWTFYYAMNYDFIKRKEVPYKSYFILPTSEDSSQLKKLIENKLMGGELLSEDSPFFENAVLSGTYNLEGDSISFDYSDYALGQGPSLESANINKKSLLKFISQEYGGAQQAASDDFYKQIKNYNLKPLWLSDSIYLDYTTAQEPHWIKHPEPLGFIDTNYQRFYIHFNSVEKNPYDPDEYFVTGKTRVKNSICSFKGTFKVKSAVLGIFVEDSLFKTGTVLCDVVLYEDKKVPSPWVIRGNYNCSFLIDQTGKLRYNALMLVADNYCNNQFKGTWTSYKTGIIKKCCWGDFRIPDSREDFDWGTGDFYPNERYRLNGWEGYVKAYLGEQGSSEAIKARKTEEREWWK